LTRSPDGETPRRAVATPTSDRDLALLRALTAVVGAAVICDAEGYVVGCSPQATSLLGPLNGIQGSAVDSLLARQVTRRRHRRGPLAAALTGEVATFVATVMTLEGRPTEVLVSANPLHSPDGAHVIGALMTLQRRDLRSTRAEALMLGLHDPLTGLPNRRLLADRMQQAIARARRNGESFVVCMIDLDRFKEVNDEHGHEYGDELLRQVGARLTGAARPNDTIARIGGDEFAGVFEGIDSSQAVESIAHRLLEATVTPVSIRGIELGVGASVGMSLAGAEQEPEALLHHADLAMYEAKSRGPNNWALFHDDMAHEAHRLAHLVSELRRALAAGTITVAYQPEIDLQHGVAVGYEALVRWAHPELGDVPALELVEAAERSDMISALGSFVLDRACGQAAHWAASAESTPPWISVNVSARELVDPDFARRVLDTLERWSLPASRLFLELTESILIQASTAAEGQLARLHAAGVRLSIDDFGTGYASLTYLQRLPVHQVKIDRSFVSGLPESREDDIITTSVIGLAHNLDLTVVAEGIETAAQSRFLRAAGCDLGQGYLFAKPRPGDQLMHGSGVLSDA
jgi:diguanylate cyclase (GGDEF)-like protein